jgi:imidazolonepropionase-like amidohydrolase
MKLRTFFALLFTMALANPAAAQTAPVTAIKAGRLVDVAAGQVRTDQVILIEGERIKAVGAAASTPIPVGAKVIDLSAQTVMPGLIDTHVHLGSDPSIPYVDRFRLSIPRIGIIGAANSRKTLLAGVTTVRNLGSTQYMDVALRQAIERGEIIGPRIFAAGAMLSMTGGHGDSNLFASQYNMHGEALVDSADDARRSVREHVKFGVDIIKFATSGGVFSANTAPGMAHFTQEEANVIVETARALGKTTAVHAHGAGGVKMAIRAGADSVEHASLMDDEAIQMAVKSRTILSMDIYNTDYTQAEGRKLGIPEESIRKDSEIGEIQRENFRKAARAGARLSFGTDAGVYPHGDNPKQLGVMVRYGMTPMQALQAATRTGADLIKRSDDLGVIKPGAQADIIAVSGDPISDFAAMEKTAFVMKAGRVYRGEPAWCAAAPAAWACEAPIK